MGAPDILIHLAAAGVTLKRSGGNLVAAPKSAVTPDVLQLIKEHKPELLDALSGDQTAPNLELQALVDAVATFHGFTAQQRAEAHHIAQADQEAALECFRGLVAAIPKSQPARDDRVTCAQCAYLTAGGRCAKWRELGAGPGYQPIADLLLRCEQYKPLAHDPDQRSGLERWPNLGKVKVNE